MLKVSELEFIQRHYTKNAVVQFFEYGGKAPVWHHSTALQCTEYLSMLLGAKVIYDGTHISSTYRRKSLF